MMNKIGLKSLLIGVATTLAVAAGNAGVMFANADQNTRNFQQDGDKTSIVVVDANGAVTDHISASFVYADQGPAAMAALRAGIPAGGRELLTANIQLNNTVDYSHKRGTLVINVGDNAAHKYYGMLILDSKGVAHFFPDADNEWTTMTINLDTDGYACMIVEFDNPPTGAAAKGGVAVAGAGGTYVVKRGDSLSSIARAHGTTVAAIAQKNGIKNVNLIHVGQTLIL